MTTPPPSHKTLSEQKNPFFKFLIILKNGIPFHFKWSEIDNDMFRRNDAAEPLTFK